MNDGKNIPGLFVSLLNVASFEFYSNLHLDKLQCDLKQKLCKCCSADALGNKRVKPLLCGVLIICEKCQSREACQNLLYFNETHLHTFVSKHHEKRM